MDVITENKLSPILRFSDFTNSYKSKIFNEITEITRLAGYEYSKYWKEDNNKEIIALRGYNIGKGFLDLKKVSFISNKLSLQLIRSKLFKGDIVYPCVGSIGNAVVIEENDKYHIQQNIAKITCKESVCPYYLVQFLTSHYGTKQVFRFNASGAQPNVLVGSLRNYKINLPSISEQQKIAEFLSSVDKKIQLLENKKEQLELYKKGVMQKIFSQEIRFKDDSGNSYPEWEEMMLGKVGKLINGLTYSPKDISDDGVLVLRSSNIQNNQLSFEDNVYVNIDSFNAVKENDILICVRNGSKRLIGKNCLIDKDNEGVAFGAFMTIYRSAYNKFIFHLFSHSTYYKYIHKNLGATINSINNNDLKKFKILFPCELEQEKIADFLKSIDCKIKSVSTQIEKTKEFKKGLLQQMFV